MKILKLLLPLLFLLLISTFVVKMVKAQEKEQYVIKPAIVVPQNWEPDLVDIDELEKKIDGNYKQIIIDALKEVKEKYASELNGHTFTIDEDSFEVIRPNEEYKKGPLVDTMYESMGGRRNFLPVEDKTIRVIWVLGTLNSAEVGRKRGFSPRIVNDYGEAILNSKNYITLTGKNEFYTHRGIALHEIAHELGHALDLNNTRYSKSHPCSDCSLHECWSNELAPLPLPIPSCLKEYDTAIMGYGTHDLSELHFNNSLINPEIRKLYGSRFINPQGDFSPETVESDAGIPFEITSISPNPIFVGGILDIKGKSFGTKQDSIDGLRSVAFGIAFFNKDLKPNFLSHGLTPEGEQTGDYEILEWRDDLIRVLIKQDALDKYRIDGSINFIVFVQRLGADGLRLRSTARLNSGAAKTFNLSIIAFGTCHENSQPRLLDCSKGHRLSFTPKVVDDSCQWVRTESNNENDQTECAGLGTGWEGTTGCGNKDDVGNQVSDQQQCAFSQRCFADYFRDESTQCIWQNKVNTDGEYAGKTFHCDRDISCVLPGEKPPADNVTNIQVASPQGSIDATNQDSVQLDNADENGSVRIVMVYESGKVRQLKYLFAKPVPTPTPTPEEEIAPTEEPTPTDTNQESNNGEEEQ